MAFTKRLAIHFRSIQNNPPLLCYAEPEDPSKTMAHWIEESKDMPYAEGKFHLTIGFPTDFPLIPPTIHFITPVFHPNISANGEICLDILLFTMVSSANSTWPPQSLCSLLTDPNTEHELNRDALKLYRTDKTKYDNTVRA
ncbi:unnamed protein product [Rotaria socialis]|uniref:UBC core domain-containing protein n=1 Tax=Rotaria socialis TaxID=392032 RepID=A0A820USU2_9BILA|nr:unnamed protein product [Rotaria socialis]CAF3265938.1 unnamed protein product [Rotaria socialis]CAF3399123.1 unnamed protein product [Rotaria socialis]CAF3782966.1 unnamed protein product [Rotaria socialis]CAF4158939.1 unnamed protein product [Rotaria socialis]